MPLSKAWQGSRYSSNRSEPPSGSNRDDVVRRFWAAFLGSKVDRSGRVDGYSRWCFSHSGRENGLAHHFAEWCWLKIERDSREVEECIAAGVAALQDKLDAEPKSVRSEPEYATFRFALIDRIFAEHLTPAQVAVELLAYRDSHASGEVPTMAEIGSLDLAKDDWRKAKL